jgi:hypothetical protein
MAARTKCMTGGGRTAGRVLQPHQHRQRHQHCGSCRLRATYAGAREETSMCLSACVSALLQLQRQQRS